jgi:hypothetical protein
MEKKGTAASPATALVSNVLPVPAWADQQHALGNARPETAIVLRILQEIDDLDQLRLGLIPPRHIGERHTGVLFHEHLDAALTDVEKPAHALLLGEAAEQEEPDAKEGYR